MPLRLLLLLSFDFADADADVYWYPSFSLQIGTLCLKTDVYRLGTYRLGMDPCDEDELNEHFFWERSSAHGDAGLLWDVDQKSIRGEGLCMTAPDAGLERKYPENLDACHPEQGIVLRPCVHSKKVQQWKYRDDYDQRTFYLAKYPKKCIDFNPECERLILWDCDNGWNQKFIILASGAQIGSANGFLLIVPVAVGFVVCGVLLVYLYHWKGRNASNVRVMELRNGILQYRQEGDGYDLD